jgi:hypothetical protein
VIRIERPKRVPARLAKQGRAARQRDLLAFEAGVTMFEFAREIYGHHTVKRALVKAQHGKCCFCESKVTHVSNGHVEHFRPKGGVRQSDQDPLEQPGYFWLAYEWTNLLFACELCNARFKKNLFPLVNPATRARRPDDDLAREDPLFIDPSRDEPGAPSASVSTTRLRSGAAAAVRSRGAPSGSTARSWPSVGGIAYRL